VRKPAGWKEAGFRTLQLIRFAAKNGGRNKFVKPIARNFGNASGRRTEKGRGPLKREKSKRKHPVECSPLWATQRRWRGELDLEEGNKGKKKNKKKTAKAIKPYKNEKAVPRAGKTRKMRTLRRGTRSKEKRLG